MKIRLLTLLILCLSLHTTKGFAHPKPDGMSEAEHDAHHDQKKQALQEQLNRLEKKVNQLEDKSKDTSNRVGKIEGQRKGEKKIKQEGQQTSIIIASLCAILFVAAVYFGGRRHLQQERIDDTSPPTMSKTKRPVRDP